MPLKEKILVVDDSPDLRRLLAFLLKAAGYEIFESENGPDALKNCRDLKPDLILLDILMPGMDGLEVCSRLKLDDATRDIPVIFLSAMSEASDKIKGLETGGVDYITKPFDKGEVLARVRNQLKIRRLTAELTTANRELSGRQAKIEEDLKAAAEIQRTLLPRKLPDQGKLGFAWKFMPSQVIGGDIFNVFPLDEDHTGVYILDVSGHGVPSAMITVSVSQMLQPGSGYVVSSSAATQKIDIISPAGVLKYLDHEYPFARFERFFTICYMVLNNKDGGLVYSSAAHPPPVLLRRDGEIELLDRGGTIIGMDGILPFESEHKQLRSGDKVILYTDGLIEFCNSAGEFYGEERFYSLLKDLRGDTIHVAMDRVMSSIMDFGGESKPEDDVSLLGIGYK